jgi:hypothetical protein
MSICTAVLWFGWALIINFINPSATGVFGFIFFYATLFLALTGSITIIGLIIRIKSAERESIAKEVSTALRQGVLFAVLIVGLLFLQSLRLLSWWNVALFILAVTLIEFFLISFKRSY